MTSTTSASQILIASLAGTAAYNRGESSAPCQDAEFMPRFADMIHGREIGYTPDGQASTIAILKAYGTAWHAANADA